MKTKKFLELSKAKGIAVLMAVNIFVLYITRDFFVVSSVLMIFLGLTALLRAKIAEVEFKEKRSEIKKGFYFSAGAVVLGFVIEKIFEINLIVELILAAMVLVLLKEIYSEKKDKWINAFLLMGFLLLFAGIFLLFFNLVLNQIFLLAGL